LKKSYNKGGRRLRGSSRGKHEDTGLRDRGTPNLRCAVVKYVEKRGKKMSRIKSPKNADDRLAKWAQELRGPKKKMEKKNDRTSGIP